MNQVPEIKEGLQFTYSRDLIPGTVYTVDCTDDGWVVIQKTNQTGEEHYSLAMVEGFFDEGLWVFKGYSPPKPTLSTVFSSQPHNVVMTALDLCSQDYRKAEGVEEPNIYLYLENTSATALVTEVVDKIHQLGFTIIPK